MQPKAESRYLSTQACLRGHVGERYVSTGACVACAQAQRKRWRAANIEKARASQARWKAKNPEKYRGAIERWRQNNPDNIRECEARYHKRNAEKRREKARNWRDANREKARASWRARRARKAAATGSHTADDVAQIRVAQRNRCGYCRISFGRAERHVDHIIPLSRGGSNDRRNLQMLCEPCNLEKRAKDPIKYARERGMLL